MSKLLIFLCFLVLLSFPIKSAGKNNHDTFDILTKLEKLEIEAEEDDEFGLFDFPSSGSLHAKKTVVSVDSFDAVGDGETDDTQAFVDAWEEACATTNAVLLIPDGNTYLVSATKFSGPCESNFVVQIDGTIVAPSDPQSWDPENPRKWLVFTKLTSFIIQGAGIVDGSGGEWWAQSCKRKKSNPCNKAAPTALTIDSSSSVRMSGMTIQNGQQMNVIISHCDTVRVMGVKVSAPGSSPNTDGIHLTSSTNVVIQNCQIGTGDDCISIVDGCSNIKMKKITCGPGHGISIGSLGNKNSTGEVEKVFLDTAYLNGTTNGLRIKTYQGGNGFVRNVRYQKVKMENVANPILIDQFYCDKKKCPIMPSAVEISQIMYRSVMGTSPSQDVMKFACSDSVPCTDIFLSKINLQNEDGTAKTYCNSAYGVATGSVEPPADCLLSSEDDEAEINEQIRAEHVVHTEL
ncbi:hypothetical protein CASFOL_012658 [Castilleja foliolosa]|uniref:endo-polygalacturonase n=1 Tax=Castilleja foliolosa TaxID=1961234 RepID=A0ABD3DHV8_9LAMI